VDKSSKEEPGSSRSLLCERERSRWSITRTHAATFLCSVIWDVVLGWGPGHVRVRVTGNKKYISNAGSSSS